MRRPLVQLDATNDPELVVAPGMIRDALGYTLSGYLDGGFAKDPVASPEMRKWLGDSDNERGTAFSREVGQAARELGWNAEIEVPVRRILTGKTNERFGDIDVLCWNVDSGRVLLLECKHLHFHKTLRELAEQVQDYRGEAKKGKRDDMRKHVDRTDAIRAKPKAMHDYLKIQEDLQIESWVVFRYPVPVLLTWINSDTGVRVTTFEQLRQILT